VDPFTTHTGTAVALRRSDVDTDQIIPSDWLKRVERTGFGAGLFSEWREDPSFVLNRPEYAGASVLVAGENFGTGSSREHAVWALQDYGFRAVVSPRFADIFRSNSLKGGLLPVQLPVEAVRRLMDLVEVDPTTPVTVDLAARELRAGTGVDAVVAAFELDDFTRWRLMEGLDDIGLTLRHESDIADFEHKRPAFTPTTHRRAAASA
jgi:3-isopropylmalate/(R)-2-methylmalate dehydratase small subunit